MIKRTIAEEVLTASKEYPIVMITGPRQSGKTTLCKMLFPKKKYLSLEDIETRGFAHDSPKEFISSLINGAILDEVQNEPKLLSTIQSVVDERNESGLFILTGSCNFLLMKNVSQSLAGRVAIINLLPFSLSEMKDVNWLENVDDYILNGGYPRLISFHLRNKRFYEDYISEYIARDVRLLLNVKDLLLFKKFLVLCAGRIGSVLNYTNLADEIGINIRTLKEWMSILEASFICFLLPPWYENRTKRLIKSPKLYFYDTGVACSLLGIDSVETLKRDKLRGELFENLVIVEEMKKAFNIGDFPSLYYYRTLGGIEVDLVEYKNRKLYPIEIKSSMTFNPSFVDNLLKFQKEYSDECGEMSLIYTGSEDFTFKDVKVKNYLVNKY